MKTERDLYYRATEDEADFITFEVLEKAELKSGGTDLFWLASFAEEADLRRAFPSAQKLDNGIVCIECEREGAGHDHRH